MTKTAWAHLPNAKHIDRVLASLKAHPKKWKAARGGAWSAVYIEARVEAWNAAWNAAQTAARVEARGAARGAARDTAWDAITALIALVAWDDCAYMLELPEDALKLLRAVGNEQALLLFGAANILKETS